MPKGKKKGRSGRRQAESRQVSDEEYDTCDTASVISATSDVPSVVAEGVDEVDEISVQEEFEDRLKDCIDGASQKSAKGRCECLLGLKSALSKKYLFDFLYDRKITMTDILERCLKKGKGEEQGLAATVGVLLCLQLGVGSDSEDVYHALKPILTVISQDNAASTKARSQCCGALGLLTFLACGDVTEAGEVMRLLEHIFKASYLKGDRSSPMHSPEIAAMHTNALMAWSLLLSIAPPNIVENVIDTHLEKLSQLLLSSHVDLRISAGEAIALVYELAREEEENFEGDDIETLCNMLKELATDGNKYRAKKDRRQQRSSFRDILRAVQEGEVPVHNVRIGMEYISVNSWARKRQYDSLCHILGPGMNIHLAENELVRDIFGLGAPIPIGTKPVSKSSKFERHLYNAAAFKARTKARAKNRDKRSVVMGDS